MEKLASELVVGDRVFLGGDEGPFAVVSAPERVGGDVWVALDEAGPRRWPAGEAVRVAFRF